jgi:hypothetical protein
MRYTLTPRTSILLAVLLAIAPALVRPVHASPRRALNLEEVVHLSTYWQGRPGQPPREELLQLQDRFAPSVVACLGTHSPLVVNAQSFLVAFTPGGRVAWTSADPGANATVEPPGSLSSDELSLRACLARRARQAFWLPHYRGSRMLLVSFPMGHSVGDHGLGYWVAEPVPGAVPVH